MATQEVAQSVPSSFGDSLYFVKCAGGPIKIGRATNPAKRLGSLRSGSYQRLELLATLPGKGYEEKVWHMAFQDYRLTGEWFRADKELTAAIERATKGERWFDHIAPPFAVDLSDDEEEWDDDVCDWQIAVELALAAARDGEKSPTRDVVKFQDLGLDRLVAGINRLAEQSLEHPQ